MLWLAYDGSHGVNLQRVHQSFEKMRCSGKKQGLQAWPLQAKHADGVKKRGGMRSCRPTGTVGNLIRGTVRIVPYTVVSHSLRVIPNGAVGDDAHVVPWGAAA